MLEAYGSEGGFESAMGRVSIRLAKVPDFALDEYHPDQVTFYSKLTELVFKAFNLPSTSQFMEELAGKLSLGNVEVQVLRMPSAKSRVWLESKEGKLTLVRVWHRGRIPKEGGFIDVYPDRFWSNRRRKPHCTVNIGRYILNISIKALIHEMLHQAGVHDEAEVERLTERHHEGFKQTYRDRWNKEFKPLLKEWKRLERELGLTYAPICKGF
jgi:hypothetical protein